MHNLEYIGGYEQSLIWLVQLVGVHNCFPWNCKIK